METSPNIHTTEETMKEAHQKDTILENAKQGIRESLEKLPTETKIKLLEDVDRIFLEKHDELDNIAKKMLLTNSPSRNKKNQDTTPNNLAANYEDITTVVLRYIDDSLIKDIPSKLTSLVHGSDGEIELAITRNLRELKGKDIRDTTKKIQHDENTNEQNERILELIGEMHEILHDIKKYKNKDIFERAGKGGIDKLPKIQEIIQKNLQEYHAAKIKLTGALGMSDGIDEGERDMLIGLATDQLLKIYNKFLKPPVSKKQKEFEATIKTLDKKSKDEIEKKWQDEKGILYDKIEVAFEAEIKSLAKTQLFDLERINTPGLLRIDHTSQPVTEDISIQKLPKQKPTKKSNIVSGLFKRLFG